MTKKLYQSLYNQKKLTTPSNTVLNGMLGVNIGGQALVEVPSRSSFVYVRLRQNPNEVIQAFNNQVSQVFDLPVQVHYIGFRYEVIGVDTTRYGNNWNAGSTSFVPKHGIQHTFPDNLQSAGGGDVSFIYPRQYMPMLATPSGTLGGPNVLISSYIRRLEDGSWHYDSLTGTRNLVPTYVPTNNNGVMALIYKDYDSGNPYVLVGTGTPFANSITGTSQIYQYIPSLPNPRAIPIMAVRLVSGTSSIGWDNLVDVRQWFYPFATGSGGGGGSPTGPAGGDLSGTYPNPYVLWGDGNSYYSTVYAALHGSSLQDFSAATPLNNNDVVPVHDIISQTIVAKTTGGTSTAYTISANLSGVPSLTTNERFNIKFHTTAGANPTLERDGLGAKPLKYYDGAGTKQACGSTTIITNMISDIIYDGTDYIVITPVGKPSGSNQQVQYNLSGSFGADSKFLWDYTNREATFGGVPALHSQNVVQMVGDGIGPTLAGWSYTDGTGPTNSMPLFVGFRSGGTGTTPTAVVNNMGLARFAGRGYDGSGWGNTQGQYLVIADGNWTTTSHPTRLELYTTNTGSTSEALAVTIDKSGILGVAGSAYVGGALAVGTSNVSSGYRLLVADGTTILGFVSSADTAFFVVQNSVAAWELVNAATSGNLTIYNAISGVNGMIIAPTGTVSFPHRVLLTGPAIASPYTLPSFTIYDDTSNYGYITYGADTIFRIIYAKGAAGAFVIGQSSNNAGVGGETVTNRLYIDKTGLCGINKTPTKPLDVNGEIRTDVALTTATVIQTRWFPMNINGTEVKVLCAL